MILALNIKCSHMRYTEKQNTNTNNLQRDVIALARASVVFDLLLDV